jgi:hypothetical protein
MHYSLCLGMFHRLVMDSVVSVFGGFICLDDIATLDLILIELLQVLILLLYLRRLLGCEIPKPFQCTQLRFLVV